MFGGCVWGVMIDRQMFLSIIDACRRCSHGLRLFWSSTPLAWTEPTGAGPKGSMRSLRTCPGGFCLGRWEKMWYILCFLVGLPGFADPVMISWCFLVLVFGDFPVDMQIVFGPFQRGWCASELPPGLQCRRKRCKRYSRRSSSCLIFFSSVFIPWIFAGFDICLLACFVQVFVVLWFCGCSGFERFHGVVFGPCICLTRFHGGFMVAWWLLLAW